MDEDKQKTHEGKEITSAHWLSFNKRSLFCDNAETCWSATEKLVVFADSYFIDVLKTAVIGAVDFVEYVAST